MSGQRGIRNTIQVSIDGQVAWLVLGEVEAWGEKLREAPEGLERGREAEGGSLLAAEASYPRAKTKKCANKMDLGNAAGST